MVDEDEEEEGFIVDAADVVGRIEGRGKEVWEGLWWTQSSSPAVLPSLLSKQPDME